MGFWSGLRDRVSGVVSSIGSAIGERVSSIFGGDREEREDRVGPGPGEGEGETPGREQEPGSDDEGEEEGEEDGEDEGEEEDFPDDDFPDDWDGGDMGDSEGVEDETEGYDVYSVSGYQIVIYY